MTIMNTTTITLGQGLSLSRIIHGHWRLMDWALSPQELLTLTLHCMELGVTTFDHADIYGNYSCEAAFGAALNLNKGLRSQLQIISKCGIKLISNKYPERKVKTYDYSASHIIQTVDNSLRNFNTEYLDVLLLHRPAPYIDPAEVASTFAQLKKAGKVLHFGVSNFTPQQFATLNHHCQNTLVTNQLEISPYCLEHFDNGNLEFCQKEGVVPMAWSPLAQGKLFNPIDDRSHRIKVVLEQIALEREEENTDKIIYSWLLQHPAQIIPIVGSGKLERIKFATEALDCKLTLEQWYRIYNASTGVELP